jgi:hypothetical protein
VTIFFNKAPATPNFLSQRILDHLNGNGAASSAVTGADRSAIPPSVVLFLLSPTGDRETGLGIPSLVLTKRSSRVRQPGDLCCPGGGLSERLDAMMAPLLGLPGGTLHRWPLWNRWRSRHPRLASRLSVFMAAGLREGVEEMRLNPFDFHFLGVLPPSELVMFERLILPLVGWLPNQQRFRPNWEVERMVSIPLDHLLNPENYACYRITVDPRRDGSQGMDMLDLPCFVHRHGGDEEILWGVTFRITMDFLGRVFAFSPPPLDRLPVIRRRLSRHYRTGDG